MKNKLMNLSSLAVGFGAALITPVIALAQVGTTSGSMAATACGGAANGGLTVGSITTIQGFICKLNEILTAIIPFIVTLGIVYFVWGVVSYVIASDEEAKSTGRNRMIYGIIGLVVITGVWGLVYWVSSTFGLNNTGATIVYPTVPY